MHPSTWRSSGEARQVARIASVIVLLADGLIFFGWLTDNALIKSSFPEVSPVSAFLLILVSLTILLLISGRGLTMPRILAGLTVLIGVSRLVEVLFNTTLGVDHLFIFSSFGNQPKQVSPNAALAFVLMAGALLPNQTQSLRRVVIGQTCALLVVLIASVAVGLSIVKQAIDAHGGTIQVESRINAGTTFIVRLPRLEAV